MTFERADVGVARCSIIAWMLRSRQVVEGGVEASHPALTAPLSGVYSKPSDVGGWLGWIEPKSRSWIAFLDTAGQGLLWEAREADGAVVGNPRPFRRARAELVMRRRAALKTLTYRGMAFHIDRPIGTVTQGTMPDGEPITITYTVDYGFVANTGDGEAPEVVGWDGDALDAYLGPDLAFERVYVGVQLDAKTGSPRQQKTFLGFPTREAAMACFRAHQHPDAVGPMQCCSWESFAAQVEAHRGKAEPITIVGTNEDVDAPAKAGVNEDESMKLEKKNRGVDGQAGGGHALSYGEINTTIRTLAALSLTRDDAPAADRDPAIRATLTTFLSRSEGSQAAGLSGSDAPLPGPDGLRQRRVERVAIRESAREADYVASDPTVDSYGEIVLPEWDFSRFQKNPVILWSHQSYEPPIGHAKRWEVSGDQLLITVFHSAAWDLAKIVWELVVEQTVRAGSVGFVPGRIFQKMVNGVMRTHLGDNLLHEFSICSIPANPNALVQEADVATMARALLAKAEARLRATSFIFPKADEAGAPKPKVDEADPPPSSELPASSREEPDALAKGAPTFRALPPATTTAPWSAGKAIADLRVWASKDGSGDPWTIQWAKYATAFGFVRSVGDVAAYHLPLAVVEEGKLALSRPALLAAVESIQAGLELAIDGIDATDMAAVRALVGKHCATLNITTPWPSAAAPKDDTTMKHFAKIITATMLAELAAKGMLAVHCDGCGAEMRVEIPTLAKSMQEATAPLEAKVAEATAAKEKALADLTTMRTERDEAVVKLAVADLAPMIGVDAHHISSAEATELAELSISAPKSFEKLVAERRSRFVKATGGQVNEKANEGGGAQVLPTHVADPTPVDRSADAVPAADAPDPLLARLERDAKAALAANAKPAPAPRG